MWNVTWVCCAQGQFWPKKKKSKTSYLFISIKVNKSSLNSQLSIKQQYWLKVAGWLRNKETSINMWLCLSALWSYSRSGASRFTCRMGLRKAAVTVGWGTMSLWAVGRSSHTLSLWCRRRMTSTSRPLRTRGPKQTATRTPTLVSELKDVSWANLWISLWLHSSFLFSHRLCSELNRAGGA